VNRLFERWLAALPAALCVLVLLSCGGGGSPSTPSSPPPTAPPTAPPPTGGNGACPLGNGSVNAECSKGTTRLIDAVFNAQDLLLQQKPQIFDQTQEAGAGTGQYLVLDKEAYLDGVTANLRASRYCAQRDPDDPDYERIQVKNENGFSENFDVVTGAGYMRKSGIYRETCTPASFPVDRSAELPPAGSGCGKPYPPPVTRFNVKVHVPGEVDNLDSTPLVGPDVAYCALIGYTDSRSFCPVRMEGSPERVPCETWAVGNAQDTGRPGPTWTREPEGTLCTGPDSGCQNHSDNQYALDVYRGGTYRATGRNGAYGQVYVDRPQ
jgi:hypothetical protein